MNILRLRTLAPVATMALVVVAACAPPPAPAVPAPAPATPAPAAVASAPVIGIYGDSIAFQSIPWSDAAIHDRGLRVRGLRFPGLAACDVVPSVLADLSAPRAHRPRVVVVSSVGNSVTECMRTEAGGLAEVNSPEYLTAYDDALRAIAEATAVAGVPMLFTWGPSSSPFGETWDGSGHIALIAAALADEHPHLRVVDVGASVMGADGDYGVYLPCLADETADDGCVDGEIRVRVSEADGHFHCRESETAPSGWPRPCPVYSSGARRYGEALAAAALFEWDARNG